MLGSSLYFEEYDGSRLLLGVANKLDMPIDMVNFLSAQAVALIAATLFRKTLQNASVELRHTLCLVFGLLMGYYCFGRQSIHLSLLPMLCFILLKSVSREIMGNVILATSLVYLSCLHLHSQLQRSTKYSLDITGPLMVITQRVTSLAYYLQDSLTTRKTEPCKSSDVDKVFVMQKLPTPLEYFSFTLAFQTLMCGPVVFYKDYIHFIEGTTFDEHLNYKSAAMFPSPSPLRAVVLKLAASVASATLYLSLQNKYPLVVLSDLSDPTSEVSRTWSACYLLWYSYLATLVVRCKYYHAWLMSEAICNNSGMGFNGYDLDGQPKWDKMSNIDVIGFEFSSNFRTAVANWNKNTNAWLRDVAYDRGSTEWRTTRVYTLSAIWHGFYPGYYMTFLAGGLFTVSARKIRSVFRPMFLNGVVKKKLYDIATFATTRVAMTYATVPFVLLHLQPSLAFYGKFYYLLHVIAACALLLPERSNRNNNTKQSQTNMNEYNNVIVNGNDMKIN